MTPQGHIFASAVTLVRTGRQHDRGADPGAHARQRPITRWAAASALPHKSEDAFWHGTLRSLAARFGVNGIVQQRNS